MAGRLANGGKLMEGEMRHVSWYFPRHAGDNLDATGEDGGRPSRGSIARTLCGGDGGCEWGGGVVGKLDKRDAGAGKD